MNAYCPYMSIQELYIVVWQWIEEILQADHFGFRRDRGIRGEIE